MNTYFVFDIDTTLANNDERAKVLHPNCVVCGVQLVSTDGSRRQDTWCCPMCGGTDATIPQKSWDNFCNPDMMSMDSPIPKAQEFMRALRGFGGSIHFVTGRNEKSRSVTETWLATHYGYAPGGNELLLMRTGAFAGLPASVYKERAVQILKEKLDPGLFIFFEDDPFVFSMYQKHGLVVRCPEAWDHFIPSGRPRTLEKAWNR